MAYQRLFFVFLLTCITALYIPNRRHHLSKVKTWSILLERSIVDETEYPRISTDYQCRLDSIEFFRMAQSDGHLNDETYIFALSRSIIHDIHKGLYGWDQDMLETDAAEIEKKYRKLFVLLDTNVELDKITNQMEQKRKITGLIDSCRNHKYWLLVVVARHVNCFASEIMRKHGNSVKNYGCTGINPLKSNQQLTKQSELMNKPQENW